MRERMGKRLLAFAMALALGVSLFVVPATTAHAAVLQGYVEFTETNFPDPAFRAYLSENFEMYRGTAGETVIGINTVTEIDVSDNKEIKSLAGIERLTSLKTLRCKNTNLTSLDVSGNTNLRTLYCNGSKLTSLKTGNNPNLHTLHCEENQLATLDVRSCEELTYLYCGENQLKSLDLSQNLKLKELYCGYNQLTAVDFGENEELYYLECWFNQITSLDLSHMKKLVFVYGQENNLKTLKLDCPKLDLLYCQANCIENLDVSKCPKLSSLVCDYYSVCNGSFDFQPETSDTSGVKLLANFYVSDKPATLDFSGFKHADVLPKGEIAGYDVATKTLTLDSAKWKKLTGYTEDDVIGWRYETWLNLGTTSFGIFLNENAYNPALQSQETGGGTTGGTGGGTTGGETPSGLLPVNVTYHTHIQTYGDKKGISTNGQMSGTSGESKRLENIWIKVSGNSKLGVQYTTHCQSYGWLPWSANGETNGTSGESKRLEAIKIQLTGGDRNKYDIFYRVHAQTYGWLGWAKNGEPAGTAGYGKRLEGIQIVVLPKGSAAPAIDFAGVNASGMKRNEKAYIAKAGSSPVVGGSATSAENPVVPGTDVTNVAYKTHVQTYGWQGWKYNGQMSGTSGKAKRLEGINIRLTNQKYTGDIVYTTHVQTFGWQGDETNPATWMKNGEMSGTSGKAKRLEAIRIALTGEMARQYDIYYRVHAQTYGWLAWAKNGDPAGTAGLAKRLEGIQIVLVPKGSAAPTADYMGVTSVKSEAYIQKK